MKIKFESMEVAEVYSSYPRDAKKKLLELRDLVFQVASSDSRVGKLEESLKWGEPSFLTNESKSGSTVRIHWKKKVPQYVGLYFNCNTTLISDMKDIYPSLNYEGNRAIILEISKEFSKKEIGHCIAMALTYKL